MLTLFEDVSHGDEHLVNLLYGKIPTYILIANELEVF